MLRPHKIQNEDRISLIAKKGTNNSITTLGFRTITTFPFIFGRRPTMQKDEPADARSPISLKTPLASFDLLEESPHLIEHPLFGLGGRLENKYAGYIPVNASGQRIDYSPSISGDMECLYYARTRKQKVCYEFQLKDYCKRGRECKYDHKKLKKGALFVLLRELRERPCEFGPSCRSLNCIRGHHCSKGNCKRGSGCPFAPLHKVDLNIAGLDKPA